MVIDDPFFRSFYPHGGVIRQATPRPSVPPSSSQPKKVVSIPIRFAGSETSKSDSALKIQKAFRGFRIRKNVKKILAIQREVDLVEKKLQERETVELIKKDDKERLKLNESLMALLFQLDSVRSVNDGVRECRRAAIKKAIMLQEKIDSLVTAAGTSIGTSDDEVKDSDEIAGETTDSAADARELNENADDSAVIRDGITQNLDESATIRGEVENNVDDSGVVGVGIQEKEEQPEAWECLADGGEETEVKSDFFELSEAVGGGERCESGSSGKRLNEEWFVLGGDGEDSKRSEKLLEKMAEDNQKLMAMVAELCSRNAAQASLISSLSQRVEQLEKAMNESLRKKKKKKNLTA